MRNNSSQDSESGRDITIAVKPVINGTFCLKIFPAGILHVDNRYPGGYTHVH